MREFIRHGGGYVGICAGAYLCSAHYSWSLDLIDTHVFTGERNIPGVGTKQMWYRGKATEVKMQLTENGRELFVDIPADTQVRYHNGPIVSPKNDPELGPYTVLAHFRSENVLHPPQKGTMVDTPAIVAATYGEGRVMSISPHPESTKGLESMVPTALRWASRRQREQRNKGTVKQSGVAATKQLLLPRMAKRTHGYLYGPGRSEQRGETSKGVINRDKKMRSIDLARANRILFFFIFHSSSITPFFWISLPRKSL